MNNLQNNDDSNKYIENENGDPYDSVYIIDDHYARKHHFDLRIRRESYLASWALPKAKFPETTEERLLLKPTPNHGLQWLTFHGEIPKGQYGAGIVKIYDKGSCRVYKWTDSVKVISFDGKHIKGFYSIINTDVDNALLIKMTPESIGHYLKKDKENLDEYYADTVYNIDDERLE
jgi:DNA ligase D-like protein (predicted 3'-phosphoesterase)